jgi:hypothetical protein
MLLDIVPLIVLLAKVIIVTFAIVHVTPVHLHTDCAGRALAPEPLQLQPVTPLILQMLLKPAASAHIEIFCIVTVKWKEGDIYIIKSFLNISKKEKTIKLWTDKQ